MVHSEEFVRASVARATLELISTDSQLLDADCSERSITHQLAIHLSKHFDAYHVHCEYNRDGFEVKKLQLVERAVCDDELDAVTVFPDIIVHVRGTPDENLLVVEVKKASSSVNCAYDIAKLQAFKSQLLYNFAVHIVIGYKRERTLVNQQFRQ
jgi:hypothetical protein